MRENKFRAWLENIDMPGSNEQMIYSDEIGLITFWKNYQAWCGEKHLMLYTGHKDKSGKEIYGEDIVEYAGARFIVKWHDQNACFSLYDINTGDNFGFYDTNINKYLVIGNTYEKLKLESGFNNNKTLSELKKRA